MERNRFNIKIELSPEKLAFNKKSCAATRQWQKENPEKVNKKNKQWRDDNPERVKEYERRKYKNNKVKCLERSRKYYKNNIEKMKEYNKQWHKDNLEKAKENGKQWRDNNLERAKEIARRWHLKSKYNLSLCDYNKMFNNQEGCCAICGRHQSKLTKVLSVDHNHGTEEVRGLLCSKCNTFIGYINEDPNVLRRMEDYFKIYKLEKILKIS